MLAEQRPRVIIHIDLDAFYCQVEQKRRGIPRDVPCAVQQWQGLIAVNYAARAAGVTRHMRVAEAKRICPQLQMVHVETIGEGGVALAGQQSAGGRGQAAVAARRGEAKASLQPYRQASAQIMSVIVGVLSACGAAVGGGGGGRGSGAAAGGSCGGWLLEKASIDEAFLDVTALAEEELRRLERNEWAPLERTVAAAGGAATAAAYLADGGGGAAGPLPAGLGTLDADRSHPNAVTAAASASDTGGVTGLSGFYEGAGGDGGGDAVVGGYGGYGAYGGDGGEEGGLPVSAALVCAAREVAGASVVVGGPVQLDAEVDRRLVAGGLIALRLRRAVRAQLDFTCSAGVAVNKLLSKVGSARNKPDKQTLVLPRGVAALLQDLPLSKLRGLGGKLGSAVESEFGAATAGAVAALPLGSLQRLLGGQTGLWVSQLVRGQCSEPVTPKDKPKSLLSCKSFEPSREWPELSRWLGILAEELVQRCADDEARHRRRARTLVTHYRGNGPRERSVRCAFPPHGREGPSAGAIAKAAMEMLRRQSDVLPCSRLAIAATEFDDPPAAGARAITNFFHSRPAAAAAGTRRQGRQVAPAAAHGQEHKPARAGGGASEEERGGEEAEAFGCACDAEGDGDGDLESSEERHEVEHERAQPARSPSPSAVQLPPSPGLPTPRRERQEEARLHVAKRPRCEGLWGAGGPSFQQQSRELQEQQQHRRQQEEHQDQRVEQRAHELQSQRPPWASSQHAEGEQEGAPASLNCWLPGGPEAAAAAGGVAGAGAGAAAVQHNSGHAPRPPPAAELPLGSVDWAPGDSGVDRGGGAGVQGSGDVMGRADVADSPRGQANAQQWPPPGDAGQAGVEQGRLRPQRADREPLQLSESAVAAAVAAGDSGGDGRGSFESPGTGRDAGWDSAGLLQGVDLDEQRRILHDIELARLRALGGPAAGRTAAGARGSHGAGSGRGGRGSSGGGKGRGRGAANQTKGQLRLTALLQPQPPRKA